MNPTRVEFPGPYPISEREIKFHCCSLCSSLNAKLGIFTSQSHKNGIKEMYKKVWKALLNLLLFDILVAVMLLDPKVPKCFLRIKRTWCYLTFYVGIMWMCMPDGRANGCSQWFLSLCKVTPSLEKPLLAGYSYIDHIIYHMYLGSIVQEFWKHKILGQVLLANTSQLPLEERAKRQKNMIPFS